MSTTIIIIIIVVFIVILIIVGIVVYFFFFSPKKDNTTSNNNNNNNIPPSDAVKYGDTVGIFNINSERGGYLFQCNPFGDGCREVAISDNSRSNWKIVRPDNNFVGTAIKYGDPIVLQGVTNNTFVGYCGETSTICGTNVATSILKNNTTTWTFNNTSGTTSNFITKNSNLELINNVDKNKLTVCGDSFNCGPNVTNKNNLDTSSDFYTWQIK